MKWTYSRGAWHADNGGAGTPSGLPATNPQTHQAWRDGDHFDDQSKIYILFVDENPHTVNWITYCRASMLYHCLPNCAGVYTLSNPPGQLRNEEDGWNLYLLAHGNDAAIGDVTGTDLANKLSKVIPAKATGFIHVQSCATGAKPAEDLANRLGVLGHHVFIKAPINNATFTDEVGFLVLDKGVWIKDPANATKYHALVARHEKAGNDAASHVPHSGNLLAACDTVHAATTQFWKDFSTLFKGVSFPTGQGWNAYETVPGKGARRL